MKKKFSDKIVPQKLEINDTTGKYEALQKQVAALLAKQEKLTLAKELAEAAVLAKSEFLANMSHDLRTPLHAILSYARFGIDKIDRIDKGKIVKYFSNIEESGKKLQEMLNKIVDLSKLEAGKMVFQMHSSSLGLVVQAIINEHRNTLTARGVAVSMEIPHDLNPVVCDNNKISQVMSTLFENAMYHAPDGSTITVTLANRFPRESGSNPALELRFRDCRTDAAPQAAITDFESYIKMERTKTGIGGNGINLAIAYEIIKFHKGAIRVENNPEGGATYSFTLPINRSDKPC